ncbi:MAG: EAL domain-containing protein [Gammaproteobacteria bacterium]|nr:MAG: EAL domain-containing protein [Gammaproteobacteria bacterium]
MQANKVIPKIVIIDDEPDMAMLVSEVAQQAGFETSQFYHARDFVKHYDGLSDVIALDLMMPDTDGVELIRYLAENRCPAQLILMSGFDSGVLRSAQKIAIEQGLNFIASINKPFRFNELYNLLSNLDIAPRARAATASCTPIESHELQAAFDNDELVVYYQPQINLRTGKVLGVEALVRWQHPQRGLVAPGLFIDLAEHNNLIGNLTWIVLEKVINQYELWKQQNIDVGISVNLSAKVLKDLEMPERVHEMVRLRGLPESRIIMEITETALMDELARSLEILTRLRMKNFRLSIDDFGTGYSSLVQLHRAPFSEIKIDRSFVIEMEQDNEARAIVETIIMLGHKLGMEVVAEGVETRGALDDLRQLGCDYAQGYYIARPMPANELLVWLRNFSVVF